MKTNHIAAILFAPQGGTVIPPHLTNTTNISSSAPLKSRPINPPLLAPSPPPYRELSRSVMTDRTANTETAIASVMPHIHAIPYILPSPIPPSQSSLNYYYLSTLDEPHPNLQL